MGNTTSTTSRKHQKRAAAPRKTRQTKTPATTGNTMRILKAKMSPAGSAPRTRTKKPLKTKKPMRTKKPVKTNNASSMAKRFGPLAWTKAKASGVGPSKTKRAPPPRKAGLFSRFGPNKNRVY